MKIDAHHHLWQYNDRDYVWMSEPLAALRRDYVLADLDAVLRPCGIEGTVAVQARQMVDETRWLLGLQRRTERIRGVVGWVPLIDAGVREHLD